MKTMFITILLLVLASSLTLAAVRIDGYKCKRGQCFSEKTGEVANGTIEGTDFKGRRFQYHFVDGRQDGPQQYYFRKAPHTHNAAINAHGVKIIGSCNSSICAC